MVRSDAVSGTSPRPRWRAAAWLGALALAVAVVTDDRPRTSTPQERAGATGPAAPAGAVSSEGRPLLVEPSDDQVARSLATLRKLDDHPLYEMTYYGPPPRVDERPSAGAAPEPAARPRVPFACTVFAAAGDPTRPLFGRNFDWDPNPALVLHSQPTDGYRSVSLVDISYLGFDRDTVSVLDHPNTAREHATALQRAVAAPFDGMNEHGLVVGMAAVDAVAEVKPGRPAVGSISILRLVLDQARTVAEGVTVLGSYNIDFSGGPDLHYLLADATGASAVVEFVDGRMHVLPRTGPDPWQVMENFHLTEVAPDQRAGHSRYRTADRALRTAAGRLSHDAALDLLRSVAQPHTQWTVVYDLRALSLTVFTDRRREHVHHLTLAG